jgi:hypothetical protein
MKKAVLGMPWAKETLTRCTNADPAWTLKDVYGHLDSAYLQEEEEAAVRAADGHMQDMPANAALPGIFYQGQGIYTRERNPCSRSSAPNGFFKGLATLTASETNANVGIADQTITSFGIAENLATCWQSWRNEHPKKSLRTSSNKSCMRSLCKQRMPYSKMKTKRPRHSGKRTCPIRMAEINQILTVIRRSTNPRRLIHYTKDCRTSSVANMPTLVSLL